MHSMNPPPGLFFHRNLSIIYSMDQLARSERQARLMKQAKTDKVSCCHALHQPPGLTYSLSSEVGALHSKCKLHHSEQF